MMSLIIHDLPYETEIMIRAQDSADLWHRSCYSTRHLLTQHMQNTSHTRSYIGMLS